MRICQIRYFFCITLLLLLSLSLFSYTASAKFSFQKGDAQRLNSGLTHEHIRPGGDLTILKANGNWNGAFYTQVQVLFYKRFRNTLPGTKWIISSSFTRDPKGYDAYVIAARTGTSSNPDGYSAGTWSIYKKHFAVRISVSGLATPEAARTARDTVWAGVKAFIDARFSLEDGNKPFVKLDRYDGAPGSPLLITASGKLEPNKRFEIQWDNGPWEKDCAVKNTGEIAVLPGNSQQEKRLAPWLWLFIPRTATPGDHTIRLVQTESNRRSDPITIRVYQPTTKALVDALDDILGLYIEQIPRNPNGTDGPSWNARQFVSGNIEYTCGWYQGRVLRFCLGLYFNLDIEKRKLMEGFDFGPLAAGPPAPLSHHFVVLWPRGTNWHHTGIFLDPWYNQHPQAYVYYPTSGNQWWLYSFWYNEKNSDVLTDFSVRKDFFLGARPDLDTFQGDRAAEGRSYATIGKGKYQYMDLVHEGIETIEKAKGAATKGRVLVKCPVHVVITDPATGRRLGSTTGADALREIPEGFFHTGTVHGETFYRFGLPSGNFNIAMNAHKSGAVQCLVFNTKENKTFTFPAFSLQQGQNAHFTFPVGSPPGQLLTSTGQTLTATTAQQPVKPQEPPVHPREPVEEPIDEPGEEPFEPGGPMISDDFVVIPMDSFPAGPLNPQALADVGVTFSGGTPAIYNVTAVMQTDDLSQRVLILSGPERVTEFSLHFATPVSTFSFSRIGVINGGSLPKWRAVAYNQSGQELSSMEDWNFSLEPMPVTFSLDGPGISRVTFYTDNRHGTGTYATFNSLPIMDITFSR